MKKIVLSLAGVLAATAFAPEAAAIPGFARQTGMACTACHAQHFPVLNSFGRAFKAGGYTMMGAQGKVEGEHLSIPDTLNASLVMKMRYQKDNTAGGEAQFDNTAGGAAVALAPNKLGDGQWQIMDEFALFFGGRIAENVGFIMEGNIMGPQLLAGFRMPFVFDMGAAKISVVPFTTDAMGAQMGYEQSSGGVYRANRWAEHRREVSAIQYNADRGPDGGGATGFAFVAQNDFGFASYTRWSPNYLMSPNGASATQDMSSSYFRLAVTPTVSDWAIVAGVGRMSGTSVFGGTAPQGSGIGVVETSVGTAGFKVDTDQTFFDFQAQGDVGGKELGVYAQYAKAPATANCNIYNMHVLGNGTTCRKPTDALAAGEIAASDRKAWTIGADYSVIPHVLSIGAAYRNAETGQRISAADAAIGYGEDVNAVTLTAVYDLYQNVAFHLNHSQYSGSGTNTRASTEVRQKHLTTFMLEAAW